MAFAFSMRVFEIAAYGASAIFLALYIMIDRDRLRGGLFAVVPRSHHIRLARVMMNLETIVGAYIRGQLITCLLIAVFSFVLLVACGVPNALALAVFCGCRRCPARTSARSSRSDRWSWRRWRVAPSSSPSSC